MQKLSNIMFQLNSRERKAMKVVVGFLTLILSVFLLPINTQAGAVVSHNQVKGPVADAEFFSVDSTGCIFTSVEINPVSQVTRTPPAPQIFLPEVFVIISQFNSCTLTPLFLVDNVFSLTDSDFQVAKKLESATLNTTISAVDEVSNTPVDISINLSWTCTTSPTHSVFHNHSSSLTSVENIHIIGTICFSATVSGTVSDISTNFTPENSSLFGFISDTRVGTIDIIK